MREGEIWKGREKLAEYLFDGDKEKAGKLIELIKSFFISTPPEFKNLKMVLPPEYSCRWCSIGGCCTMNAPDSYGKCSGKCDNYTKSKYAGETPDV